MQVPLRKRPFPLLLALALLLRILLASAADAAEKQALSLSAQEQEWLSRHRDISVRISTQYPPFEFYDKGTYQGMAVDYLSLLGEKLGISFHPAPRMTWSEALASIESRQDVDMILLITHTPERESFLRFTRDYIFFPQVIFAASPSHFIAGIQDLNGKRVAVEAGYIMYQWLARDVPGVAFHEVEDACSAIKAVATGAADAYVGNLAVGHYCIERNGYVNVKVAAPTSYDVDKMAMAVRSDWPELAALLNKGLDAITGEEEKEINHRWLAIRFEHTLDFSDIIKWVAIIAVLVAGWLVHLKTMVKRRTRDLEREIAERRHTEETLAASERNYREIFNATNEAIFLHDARSGQILDVNQAMLDMYGYTRVETLRLNISDLSSGGEKSSPQEARAYLDQAIRMGPQTFEWQARRKNGELFWGEVSLRSTEIGGEGRVLAVVRDITARRKAAEELSINEARQALILNSLPMAFYIAKPFETYGGIWVSAQIDAISGFTAEDFAADIHLWATRLHPDDFDRTMKAFDSIHRTTTLSVEYRWQHADGSYRWFQDNAVVVRDDAGKPAEIIGTWLDITDRKNLEDKLRQAQKMEAIGTLAGGIAHDFNNILAAIIGYAELAALQTKDNPQLNKYLQVVCQAGLQARDLVSQILAFSRKTSHERQPLRIGPLLKDTLKMLRATIPTTIDITQDIRSEGMTLADPTQVHQVIMNLCTNAYHAMRESGGTLAVSLDDADVAPAGSFPPELAPGRYIRLMVGDTGVGMDQETRDKIFEPYFTTKVTDEGTGLGLAVVHGIVMSCNGHVSVESTLGRGSTFTVYFPCYEGPAQPAARETETRRPVTGSEHIMFIDDEEKITNLAKEVFTMHGYRVDTYTNGIQAYQDFVKNAGAFDLVITDMTMPYMTGAELAQKLLAIKPELPIILCSGYSDLIDQDRAEAMGIAEYVQKPVNIDQLLTIVRSLLDQNPE